MSHAPRYVSAVVILAAALSACSSDDPSPVIPTMTYAARPTSATPTTVKRAPIPIAGEVIATETAAGSIPMPSMVSLQVMESPVGPILVTPTGRAVYYYLGDDPKTGKSSCDDPCAIHWPAVNANSEPPQADGVDAELGIYDRPNGVAQLTIDGRPAYFYRNDITPGSINGQGVAGMFWLVSPNGKIIKPR